MLRHKINPKPRDPHFNKCLPSLLILSLASGLGLTFLISGKFDGAPINKITGPDEKHKNLVEKDGPVYFFACSKLWALIEAT